MVQQYTNTAFPWGQSIDISTSLNSISCKVDMLFYKVDIFMDCTESKGYYCFIIFNRLWRDIKLTKDRAFYNA